MKLETAKLQLLERIISLSDASLIKELTAFLDRKEKVDGDFWDELSPEMQQEIDEAIAQAERGEVIPHEEVVKEIDRWLKR